MLVHIEKLFDNDLEQISLYILNLHISNLTLLHKLDASENSKNVILNVYINIDRLHYWISKGF